ncbi:NOL1/NOP2/sun family putative RNA methylase [archaeon]|jgi:tRNA (cytosine49-C5)-methyltransferase|nr:NOL1/NOP2/sun family putative RNA methylase [archaeon]
MLKFKQKFIDRYSELTDFDAFKEYSEKRIRKSFRVNTLKSTVSNTKKRLEKYFEVEPVPWCKEGFFIKDTKRIAVGNLREYMLGYIYIQEASSMIPPTILKPKPGDFVLDMAAAPGSKTTQMAAMMKNEGLLIANDYKYDRLKSLSSNLQRCGVANTATTLQEGRFFKGFSFDKVLLDAPCSGTGTLRKSPYTLETWNPNAIRRIAGTQRQLIKSAFENLKSGGTLTFSTCTLEPEENEMTVDYLLDTFDNAKLQKINIDIKSSKPVEEFEGKKFTSEVKKCLRIWPQDNNTDGFFVAKIKKD